LLHEKTKVSFGFASFHAGSLVFHNIVQKYTLRLSSACYDITQK